MTIQSVNSRQAGTHQRAELPELSAADHQAGHRPQPQRCGAVGIAAGHSHRPRDHRRDSRRRNEPIEELVQEAFQLSVRSWKQAVLALRNDEITLRKVRARRCFPYSTSSVTWQGSGIAGSINKNLSTSFYGPSPLALPNPLPPAMERRSTTHSTTRLPIRAWAST
jgi:hypothetical protein